MAGNTQEFRTLMYSVEGKTVVTHRLPFNANEPIGRLKLEQFIKRGFTFDDPRLAVKSGLPQVIVTQEVDLDKPIGLEAETEEVEAKETQPVQVQETPAPTPVKKWANMNAQERKAYQEGKKK